MATWKEKFNKKYNHPKGTSHSLSDISKETGVSKKGIQQIYNKGIGAYKTNPQSVRPNVTSKEQWAMARVYSSVMGGKASKVDAKELKMEMGGHTDKSEITKVILTDFDKKRYLGQYKKVFDAFNKGSLGLSEGAYELDSSGQTDSDGNYILHVSEVLSGDVEERLSKIKGISFEEFYVDKELKMENGGGLKDYYKGYYERLSPSNFDVKQNGGQIQINMNKNGAVDIHEEAEALSGGFFKKGGETDFNPDGKIKDKIVHASGDAGGMLVGKRHSNGGIKALNKSTGQPLEMEGGEVVITRNAVSDNKKRSFNGKMLTNRQILSEINESGGGVSFADGGQVPNDVKFDCNAEYEYGGKTMCGKDLAYAMGGVTTAIVTDPNEAMADLQSTYGLGDVYAKGGSVSSDKINNRENKFTRYQKLRELGFNYNWKTVSDKTLKAKLKELNSRYAKGGLIPNVGTVDDFMLKELLMKNKKVLAILSDKEIAFMKLDNVDVIAVSGKNYDFIFTDGKKEFEIINQDRKLKHSLRDARPKIVEFYSKRYAKGGTIECGSCSWSWDRKDGGDDMYVCHKCGTDNTSKYDDSKSFDKAREELGKEYLENLDKFAEGGQLDYDEFPNYISDPNKDNTLVEGLSKIKDLGGSTGATLYEYKGKQYVVKAGASEGQSVDEFLANQIYYMLDVPVPRSILLASGSLAKEYIYKERDVDYNEYSDLKLIAKGYVADALLGNWDIYKNDNIIIKEGTITPFRIDSGGSLRYRARGGKKENFGREVTELETLKENNPKLKPYITDKVIKNGIEKVIKEKENILDLFKDDGSFRIKMEARINYLERVLNEINDRRGTDFVDEDVEVKDAKTTKLSKLKKGDKFYFPLDDDDKIIGRTNPLDIIYVFDDKIKSTYHYSSEGSKFSTSTNRDVVLLIKPSLEKDLEVKVVEAKEPSFEEKFLLDKISELRKRYEIKKRYLSEIQKGIALRDIRKYEIALDEIRLNNTSFEDMLNDFAVGQTVEFGDINEKRTLRKGKSIGGEKSELTKKEYDAVRSESFLNWFGDWEVANETGNYEGVSKIINSETKEPLVVYHGTDTKFTSWETYAKNNLHYFAKKKRFADFFATSWQERTDDAGVKSAEIKSDNPIKGTFVYSCFLDIKNPIDFTPFGIDKVPFNDYLKYLEIKYDLDLSRIEGYNDLKDRTEKVYSWVVIRKWQQFNLFIKNNTPYDGFSFYEFIPDSQRRGFEDASLSFTAFNSNQIKFTNNTSFSKFTDDSRLEIGGIIF